MNSPSSAAIFRWHPASWLAVRGSDAGTFLQGQFTNELRGATGAVYGLWLNLKGKVLADSFVIPQGDKSYRICSYASAAAVIQQRLESYVIADDVELIDETDSVAALTLVGPEAETLAREISAAFGGVWFRGHRFSDPHVEYIFPREAASAVAERVASLPRLTAADIEVRRITSATPSVPQDIGVDDLPNEGGLDADAISYTKGCYLGQEVMARLKNLGQVRRKLLRVRGAGIPLPSLPAKLFVGDRAVGELRSAITDGQELLGLAMLSLLHVRPGVGLALSVGGAPVLALHDQP
jgi:folate-binding protein YgfZ